MQCSMFWFWTFFFQIQSRFTGCLHVYHSLHFTGISSLWKHEDGNCREKLSHTKTNTFKRSMWLPQASKRYYCVNTSAYCTNLLLFYCCCTLDFLFILTSISYYPWADANISAYLTKGQCWSTKMLSHCDLFF